MLDHWTDSAGAKAREKMGAVVWSIGKDIRDNECFRRLCLGTDLDGQPHFYEEAKHGDHWEWDDDTPPRVALCLLREHAREWLNRRGREVRKNRDGSSCSVYFVEATVASMWRCDYDAALIAAVLAVEVE